RLCLSEPRRHHCLPSSPTRRSSDLGEHVAELIETHRQQRSELAQQLRECGVDNPGSNVQVGEALVRAGAQDLPLSAKTGQHQRLDRKSTRLNSSHVKISYAVFCLKK